MTTLREDVLRTLAGWTAPSSDQDFLRLTYLAHVRDHAEALRRDGELDHLTASALVVSPDRSRVLLTLHRKAQQWFQLGGHLEPDDDTLAGAALREAREESGLVDLDLDSRPVHLDVHAVDFCRPGARHLDVRYVVVGAGEPLTSEESTEVRWWPVDELPSEEASLHALVGAALSR